MDPSTSTVLATAATQLASWLKSLLDADAATRERWRQAIATLQTAVLETQAYVARVGHGERVERGIEHELFNRWAAASGAFYMLDGPLAARLQLKAEYWTDPEAWTSQQVRDAGISLDHVAPVHATTSPRSMSTSRPRSARSKVLFRRR